ncbi:MAG: ACT domain-containing protein [Candidatus Bathyarchaeia archaeon]
MPEVTQIAVILENRPGALAKLCSTLGKAGVNILSLLAPEIRGRGKVRVLVDNMDKARDALKAAKIRFSEEKVVAIELDNRPGSLSEVAEKLANARINIKYAYATASEGSAKAKVILAVPDAAKAVTILGG